MQVVSVVIRLFGGTLREPSLYEIVVPLDGSSQSERSLSVASALATRFGASLRLMTAKADVGDQSPTAYLDALARTVTVPVQTEVVIDAPPEEMISAATWPSHVGVCMTTHARGRVLATLSPNLAEMVAQSAAGPVFLVGPACAHAHFGEGTVLVAHEGTDGATAVCLGMVPVVAELGDSLDVVTVVGAPSGRSADDPYRDMKLAVEPLLHLAQQHGMQAKHRIVFARDAVDGIIEEATAAQPVLIVMAPQNHSTLHRLRDGSTTMRVVHQATVPVLVVPGALAARPI